MSIYRHSSNPSIEDGLVLKGYQKKLKTMKKKYFALYKDTGNNAARLEYYDNERKFKSGTPPKRVIKLKDCFNINRRLDTRHDFVIALSTKDGGFGIVLETENEMLKWLEVLITLQRDANASSESIHPQFAHLWQVTIERRGLAEQRGLIGNYFVGLTAQSLKFIRIGAEKSAVGEPRLSNIEFLLNTIRRCGDSQCYFYIEVGRQSVIGPGEFWMQTEDSLTAQNMHSMILSAMSAKSEAIEPMRKRSSSANEASKPINVLQKRHNQTENKINNSPQAVLGFCRERCDSLPSRNRTSSECNSQSLAATSSLSVRNYTISGLRPHSYQRHSNSPPMNATIGCSESEESSVSIDEPDDPGNFLSYRYNTHSKGVIVEENTDDLLGVESKSGSIKENLDNDMKQESVSSVGNNDDSYLSMAPVYAFKENKSEEPRYASSIMEFPEVIFDKISKNSANDADSQFERPTRAYSIGSKTEHAKFNKRAGNLNDFEHNTMRVRAFSVGSRAKIPRCDLQRGIHYPKSLLEHNCNSNNNICSLNDSCLPHHLLHTTTEKKSTSAPILIHKSQNSVDRMSDLMEIDFSRPMNNLKSSAALSTSAAATTTIPTNFNTNNRIYAAAQKQTSSSSSSSPAYKSAIFGNRDQLTTLTMRPDLLATTASTPSSIFATSLPITMHSNQRTNNIENENQSPKSFSPLIETTISQTDNGYLEMKPVGDSFTKNSPAKHFKDTSNMYSITSALLANATPKKIVVGSLQTVPENNKNTAKPSFVQQQTMTATTTTNSTVLPNKNDALGSSNNIIGQKENSNYTIQQNIIPIVENKKLEIMTNTKTNTNLDEKQEKQEKTTTTSMPINEYITNRISSKQQPIKNIRDQTNLNILSARYAQLNLNTTDANTTNANLNVNINANINPNQNQIQNAKPKHDMENNSKNDDYINIKRKTNEQISAKLKQQLTTNANANSICNSKEIHEHECNTNESHVKLLTHSISDDQQQNPQQSQRGDDNKYDGGTGRKSVPTIEGGGYEILQIKSDSSLQAHKSLNRHSSGGGGGNSCGNRKDKAQLCQLTPSRPRSTNSSAITSGSILLAGCTSSSTSCLNYLSTPNTTTANAATSGRNESSYGSSPSPTCKMNNASNNPIITSANNTNANNITALAAANANTSPLSAAAAAAIASRPPSVSSEHELYYASLDLPPPSSNEINVNKLNKMDVSNGSSPVAEIASANNSYAKIHFDLSDSSSSSSKNVNN